MKITIQILSAFASLLLVSPVYSLPDSDMVYPEFKEEKEDSIKFNYGLEVNTNISVSSLNWGPTFSFRRFARHQIELGLGTTILDWEQGGSYAPFEGGEITFAYKFLPFGKTTRSSFYLQFLFKYYNELAIQSGKTQNNHHYEQLLGVGFEKTIGSRLYLRKDLGIGFIEQQPYDYWVSKQIFGGIHLNAFFRVGLGYKFGKGD